MKIDNYLHSKAILKEHVFLKKLVLFLLSCFFVNSLTTYSASAQTGACSTVVSITAGSCTNNKYTLSGIVSLTNSPAGSLTIIDGSATVEVSIPANTTAVGFTINNLPAGTGTRVVTVFSSATACDVTSGIYEAPPACSTPPCALSLVTNAGECATASNTYSLTGILTAATVASPPLTVTITTGTRTVIQSLTANSNNFVFVLNNLPADGQLKTINVASSSLECPGITDTYAAPAACSVASPCSATLSLSPTACNSVNNSYTLNALVGIANVPASGTITITDGVNTASAPLSASIGTYGFTFNNLPSTGGTGTISVTFTGGSCGPISQTYAIPAACSVATPCAQTLTVTPTACNPATNSYTLNGAVNVTNGPASGVLTVSTAGASVTFAVGSVNGNYSFSFGNLPANGLSGSITASFSGTSCGPISQTYTAPIACSVALPCSVSLALTPGSCNSTTNGYSLTTVLTANNITPPMTVTLSGAGFASVVQTLTAVNNAFNVTINNLPADGQVKTISVATSSTVCGSVSQTYTSPVACSVAPPCSVSLALSPGACSSATNSFTLSGAVFVANGPASGSLTVSNGVQSVTFPVSPTIGTYSFNFTNLPSNGVTGTITATFSGTSCGPVSQTYTAPVACSVAAPCGLLLAVSPTACNPTNNTYALQATLVANNVTPPLTVTITGAGSPIVQSLTAVSNTFNFTIVNLSSDGSSHMLSVATSATACGSISQTYTAPVACTTAVPCSVSLALTPSACNPVNNAYSLSIAVTANNITPPMTVTISGAGFASQVQTLTAVNNTFTFGVNGLNADGALKTISVLTSATACGSVSQTYTAPVACSTAAPCAVSLTANPTACNPANNSYTLSGAVTVANGPSSGILTVSNGVQSLTYAVAQNIGTYSFNFNNLPSNGATGTITATFSGTSCGPVSQTYTAPVACTTAVPCSVSLALTPSACNPVNNAYSLSIAVTANNITPPMTVTISGAGFASQVQTLTAVNNTFTFGVNGLNADGALKTISVFTSATTCGSVSQTYTAPVACSTDVPCAVSLTANPTACNPANNSYTLSGAVTVANGPSSGILTVSNGVQSLTYAVAQNIGSYSFNFNNLPSNGATGTITATFSGTSCGPVSQTYTAPVACTTAVPCSVSLALTPSACNPVNNAYSLSIAVTANNITPPMTVTISGAGFTSQVQTLTAVNNTFTFGVNGLNADGALKTISVLTSATACGSISQTYTAPVACSTAAPCAVSLTANPTACNPANNSYTLSGAVTVANGPSSGILTVSNGVQSLTYAVAQNIGTYSFNFNNLPSNGATGTITATFSGTSCGPVSQTYTAPVACTGTAPACSLSLTSSQPICSLTANAYSVNGLVTVTNGTGSQTLTVSDGIRSTTVTITGSGSASFVLTNLTSDGATHTISVVSSGTACGTTSRTYTAPANCQGPCPQLTLLILNNAQICNGQCASFSISTDATGAIELVRFSAPQTGTAIYAGGTVIGEGTPVNGILVIPQGIPGLSLPQNNGATPETYYIYARLKTPSADPNCRPVSGEAQVTVLPSPQISVASLQTCNSSTTRQVVLTVSSSGTYVATFGTGVIAVSCSLRSITGQIASLTITGGTSTTVTLPADFVGGVLVSNLVTGCQTLSGVSAVTYLPAPAFTVSAIPVSCSGVAANVDAQLSIGNTQNAATYQYVSGNTFSSATAVPVSPAQIPGNGIIAAGLANPAALTGQSYTVRVYSNSGCYTDQTVTLTRKDCACPPAECVPVTSTRIR